MAETHQQIKDRLFKTASALWGVQDTQTESGFDPLVGILLGACATELEKISHDIDETRGRTLERLVKLLYPEVLANALPAHAIAYAYPSEKNILLQRDAQFYYQKKITAATEGASAVWKNIFFTPAGDFTLQQASIKFMATTGVLYAVNDAMQKELVATKSTQAHSHAFQHTIWLGIENIENLVSDTCFYFELRNEAGKNIFYDYLPLTTWRQQENILSTARFYGKNTATAASKPDPEEIVNGKTNTINRIIKQIAKFYASRFITVTGLANHKATLGWPEPLKAIYPAIAASKIANSNIGWISIDFPENINISQLQDDIFISLNCFPVVNRHLIVAQQKLMEHVNIVPLVSDELFSDIAEITDVEGNALDGFGKNANEPLINLHYGGVERFSEKNALAAIEGLIQQLRDESVAYSNIGNDFLNTELRSLKQSLNKLEQQIAEKQLLKGDTPYLVIADKNKIGTSNIFVKYWTTNGQDANGIKPGAALSLYKNADVLGNSARLVTDTAGGRNSLGDADKVLAYKTAILSKEKLVTAEDIAGFCRLRLALKDAVVFVEKGYMVQQKNKSGFLKTIDITLQVNDTEKRKIEASGGISFWEKDLAFAITENSSFFMPVRVFIKDQHN